MKTKAFVLGSLNMDYNLSLSRLPKQGETMTSDDFFLMPGGKGANQAVALSKQDIHTLMIGSLGQDSIGQALVEKLEAYQVNTKYIERIKGQSSGLAFILIENHDNRIVVHPGANHIHDEKRIIKILNQESNPGDWLVTQFEIPMDIVGASLRYAKENNLKTVVNPSPYQSIDEDLVSLIDYLIVNQSEAESLIKHPLDNIEDSLHEIFDLGFQNLVLTMGKKGSYFFNGNKVVHQKIFETNPVDTTGAGDAFAGCFIASLIEKKTIEEALKRASMCSTMTIEHKGVQDSIPRKKDIDTRMKGMVE